MKFQTLIDTKTQNVVFDGTNVDLATQNLIIDWFFDYDLCTDEHDDPQSANFLRYFKRNLNLYYPRYTQLLRVLQVKENLDPYVTDYLESVTSRVDALTENGTDTRTPNLTRQSTDTPQKTTTTTRTPNLTDTSVITGGHTDTRTPNLSHGETNETVTKSDGFGITYPESQLNSVSLDLDIDTPRNIDYAGSEQLSGAKTTGESTASDTGTETNQTVYNSEQTQDTHIGTETTQTTESGSGQTTVTERGTDTTQTTKTGSNTSDTDFIQKGRHESVADIIPRAMSAIANSDAFTWFKNKIDICFDLYA